MLAWRAGATVHVADLSVDADTNPAVAAFKVRRSSGDLRVTDALSIDEARQALAAGRAIADSPSTPVRDLLIAGEMGIGNTTPAAILIGTITSREPVEVVGRVRASTTPDGSARPPRSATACAEYESIATIRSPCSRRWPAPT